MSDENEGPPPLSPQLHEFFEAHAKTGEPTQAELGRALLRLHGATRPTRFSLAGRRLLPPEVLAVAAVLVLSVGGAFIGWRVRSANAQTEALSTAKAAWVRGDLEAASAAFEACSTAECARLAAAVKRAKVQSENLAGLDEAEAGSLLALDRELSDGARSVLAERLEQKAVPEENEALFAAKQGSELLMAGHDQTKVTSAVSAFVQGSAMASSSPELARPLLTTVSELVPNTALARAAQKKLAALEVVPAPTHAAPAPLTPELTALLQRAKEAKKEHRFDEAVSLLEQCLRDAPGQPDCVVSLASTFAVRGNQTSSEEDNMQAKMLYLRFLEVADPMDKRIDRVREIVANSGVGLHMGDSMRQPSNQANESAAEDAYQRGSMLLERDPVGATRLFAEALAQSDPGSSTAAKARAQLEKIPGKPDVVPAWVKDRSHDLYLKGYQLRESNPDDARRLFQQVIDMAPGSTDAQKARNRLEELGAPTSDKTDAKEVEFQTALTLAVNERKLVVLKGISRVAVGDVEIADVRMLGNDKLELRGVGPGKTTILIWKGSRRISSLIEVSGSRGATGFLNIASNPTGADVILDGKSTGPRNGVLPAVPLEVPVGRHTIQFEKNGKRSAIRTIDVVEGANPVIKGEIPQ